jgi:hypothetical protein
LISNEGEVPRIRLSLRVRKPRKRVLRRVVRFFRKKRRCISSQVGPGPREFPGYSKVERHDILAANKL